MLDKYIVDLRSYPIEERNQLYKQLDDISFICEMLDDKPGIYEAFIDQDFKESIHDYLHIPDKFISHC